jgi:hypothetical protein
MIICPNCRGDNVEEARFCNTCGRSLEPEEMALRRFERREAEGDHIDFPPPKRPSAVPGIVALTLLGIAALALGGWWLLRPDPPAPDPCRGRVESQLYPYCVAVPQGWRGGALRTPVGAIDAYVPRADTNAEIQVRAGTVIPGVNTAIYAQETRTAQQAMGAVLSETQLVRIDGEPALTWVWAGRNDRGQVVQLREVILVRGTIAWRITLFGVEDSFKEAEPSFLALLQSWRFDYPVRTAPGAAV